VADLMEVNGVDDLVVAGFVAVEEVVDMAAVS
jgi:hypothetical protein